MFDTLKDKLQSVFATMSGRGALGPNDVDAALREVRTALLEADVALPVVKDFIHKIRDKALGAVSIKSVRPDQQVIKIVHDGLVEMLGGAAEPLKLDGVPPVVILLAGLQGSGKTTTAAKLANHIQKKSGQKKPGQKKPGRKAMLASLDLIRPAAREQLRSLAEQIGAAILPESDTETPVQLAKRALQMAKLQGQDVLILDTAGRLSIDEVMMAELREIKSAISPSEILLVADSLTGQDAIHTAEAFHRDLGLSGIVLTRLDGDGRGGAALSMTALTGVPVKLAGVGEQPDALEEFDPARIAGRILDKGDVVALVEAATDAIAQEDAERMAQRMAAGQFNINDFLTQLRQLQKMGGASGFLGMLPGLGKFKKQISAAGFDDKQLARQIAIILAMTKKERANLALLNASRRRRIANGSGVHVQDVNKLVKQYQDMAKMMKKMGSKSGRAAMQALMSNKGMNNSGFGNMGQGGFGEAMSMFQNPPQQLFDDIKTDNPSPNHLPGLGAPKNK